MPLNATGRSFEPNRPAITRMIAALALVLIAAFGASAGASAQAGTKVTLSGTTTNGTTISTSVTVSDASGRPVQGLASDSFAVQIDGQPVPGATLDATAGAAVPIGMVLVMDISNTMSPASISGAKDAFTQVIRSLRPSDEATLVTISTAVTQVVKPTSDQATLIAGVNGVTPGGRTALYAAVVQSVGYAKAAPQSQKVIVLVTEGGGRVGDEFGGASGNISRTMALDAAATGGAPLYVVGIGKEADAVFLTALATNSGGQYISASNGSEISQLYSRLSERLRLQYNLNVSLPEGLPAGAHTISVTSNGATGQASFNTTVPVPTAVVAPVLVPALTGIGGELSVRTTAKVTNVPGGSPVTFLLDGQPAAANASGDRRSLDLDPFRLDPSRPHTLQAQYDPADPTRILEATFNVAKLAPKITDPAGVISLQPGDSITATVQAQPGVVTTVRFIVDGAEIETDSAVPYQFTLAKDGFAAGSHSLKLVAEANGLSTESVFEFAGPKAPAQSSNALKLVLLALVALALLAAGGFGGWTLIGKAKERRGALVLSDAPERLIKWADAHRVERPRPEAAEAPVQPPRGVWGTLEITQGAGAGTKFSLSGSRVMVGSGKGATVKLNDKDVEETHFLLTSSGEVFASTPSCALSLNGEETRGGKLVDGALLRVGGTILRFSAAPSAAVEDRRAS
ncbi:MAG: VWA domain-containing protein [Tepidiformaceae bacterium]